MSKKISLFVERLINLGLCEREARVYLALLKNRSATAPVLQKASGVPQSKIYSSVNDLVIRGLCLERKIGRIRTYEAIDPAITLDSSVQNLKNQFKDSIALKKELSSIYAKVNVTAEPIEYVDIVRGKEGNHHYFCRLLRDAKNEILGFSRPPYVCDTSEKIDEQTMANEAFMARGGINRWVYEFSPPSKEWLIPNLEKLQKKGACIRVAKSLPLKMVIFDRQIVSVACEDPLASPDELIKVIINQPNIAQAFCILFGFLWSRAVELKEWKRLQDRASSRKKTFEKTVVKS